MPTVPTNFIPNVTTAVTQQPRMSGANYGQQNDQELQKVGAEGVRIGDSLNLINFYDERAKAREAVNTFHDATAQWTEKFKLDNPDWFKMDDKLGMPKIAVEYQKFNDTYQKNLLANNQSWAAQAVGLNQKNFSHYQAENITGSLQPAKIYEKKMDLDALHQIWGKAASGETTYNGVPISQEQEAMTKKVLELNDSPENRSLLADEYLKQQNETKNYSFGSKAADYMAKSGIINDEQSKMWQEEFSQHLLTADGRVAKADGEQAAKQAYQDMMQDPHQYLENKAAGKYAGIEDASISTSIKLNEMEQKIAFHEPITTAQKVLYKSIEADEKTLSAGSKDAKGNKLPFSPDQQADEIQGKYAFADDRYYQLLKADPKADPNKLLQQAKAEGNQLVPVPNRSATNPNDMTISLQPRWKAYQMGVTDEQVKAAKAINPQYSKNDMGNGYSWKQAGKTVNIYKDSKLTGNVTQNQWDAMNANTPDERVQPE